MKSGKVDAEEFLKAGGRLPKGSKAVYTAVVDQLALKVLGVLADAPSQEVRRKALEKARRMLGRR